MTLTLAGRVVLVLAALALILFLVEVAARVWAGQWPAEKVIAVAVAVPLVALIGAMAWRWEA
jgi:hypothetical protein